MTTYQNTAEATVDLLDQLLDHGRTETARGNFETLELTGVKITLTHPDEHFHTLPHRNANPFAQVAETLWVLAGRNDIEWLSAYLPRAKDFSDDGKTWRGGYGPRLRNWHTPSNPLGFDQLEVCANLLDKEPGTRRAVIGIWDPVLDMGTASKDIPCNNWIQFLQRDNSLNMHVVARSMDVMWGFSGINAFEWSVLHDMMSYWSGVSLGSVTYFVGSLHLYSRHYARAKEIVDAAKRSIYAFTAPGVRYGYATPETPFMTPLKKFDSALAQVFKYEDDLRNGTDGRKLDYSMIADPWLRAATKMLAAYWAGERSERWTRQFLTDLPWGWAHAALEYSERMWTPANVAKRPLWSPTRDLATITIKPDHKPQQTLEELMRQPTEATDDPPTDGEWNVPAEERIVGSATYASSATRTAMLRRVEKVAVVLDRLQTIKGRAYGDSWKRHGELFSIVPNVTRKVDRLQTGNDTPDETTIDTVADLAVYCIKYLTWLAEHESDSFLRWARLYDDNRLECSIIVRSCQGEDGFEQVCEELVNYAAWCKWEDHTTDGQHQCRELWDINHRELLLGLGGEVPEYEKVVNVVTMALAALWWLALERRDNFDVYAKWAAQWRTDLPASDEGTSPDKLVPLYPASFIEDYQAYCGTTHAPRATWEEMLDLGVSYVAAEAGEVLNLLNKIRHQDHPLDNAMRDKLVNELGDVLWGMAVSCNALQLDMRYVMAENRSKLSARYPDGKFSTADSVARVDLQVHGPLRPSLAVPLDAFTTVSADMGKEIDEAVARYVASHRDEIRAYMELAEKQREQLRDQEEREHDEP